MKPLDENAENIGVYHEPAFNMRHKLLMFVKSMIGTGALLVELVEADEIYVIVIESQKGIKCTDKKPRRHGESASKRGLSNK